VTPILDIELIKNLRLSARLSRRALADRLGVSQTVVRSLETGADHGAYPLDFLVRLASELGSTPGALVQGRSSERQVEADDVKVEAALAIAGKELRRPAIAKAFGWDLDRVTAAVDALGRRLEGTGLMLQTHFGGRYAIRPRAEMLTEAEVSALERGEMARKGLTVSALRLLKNVALGPVTADFERRASNSERVALGTLLKSRLVVVDGGVYRLSADAVFCLGAETSNAPTVPFVDLQAAAMDHRAETLSC
jgi:transcriptional regulator with XRE-family HTH domain